MRIKIRYETCGVYRYAVSPYACVMFTDIFTESVRFNCVHDLEGKEVVVLGIVYTCTWHCV